MKIVSISLYHVRIPLKIEFRHALASRNLTDNVIVETTLDNGLSGFGEGVPREYVTGETVDTVLETIKRVGPTLLEKKFNTPEDLIGFFTPDRSQFLRDDPVAPSSPNLSTDNTNDRSRDASKNNAAQCALELSLLDVCGKYFKRSIADILQDSHTEEIPYIFYSGIISGDSLKAATRSAIRMRCYGFKHVKAKVGIEVAAGKERRKTKDGGGAFSPSPPIPYEVKRTLRIRRVLGRRIDLRVDANEAWTPEEAILMINAIERFGVSAVEQPIKHEDLPRLKEVHTRTNVPIVLDESLCSMDDALRAVEGCYCDVFNIRLSKCGGLLSSLEIAEFARQNRIGFQLGCQVGETGILSAAGRCFATLAPDAVFFEGSYDKHLLKANVTRQNLTFGYGGKARPIKGDGLGIDINRDKLELFTVKRELIGESIASGNPL